jgi:hypothetical protein
VSIVPPSISVTLAINPPSFKLGTYVELSVTAVLNANAKFPITIFTWPSVFNLELAQMRGNFVGVDRDTGMRLPMHDIQVQRRGFSHTLGGPDDKYHITLEPGQPFRFNSSFYLPHGPPFREADSDLQEEGHADLLPGHRYLLDIRKDYYDAYLWWKKGRKEDVLDLPGQDRGGDWESGEPIVLSLDEPVEFKVLPLDS